MSTVFWHIINFVDRIQCNSKYDVICILEIFLEQQFRIMIVQSLDIT